jgi:N-acetylmuramoyl-L-alanine amidase
MKFYVTVLMLLATALCFAAPVEIRGARIMEMAFGTQLVLDTSAPVRHSSFLLDSPPRLVVDVNEARLATSLSGSTLRSADVRGVRAGVRGGRDVRIVLDLAALVHSETYMLKIADHDQRLVIDLFRNQRPDPAALQSSSTRIAPAARPAKAISVKSAGRAFVIAIDPGHGGKDPGAIGLHGTEEKTVVMQIGRRLQRLVDGEPGMRAILTRRDDRYLRLDERIDIARKHGADLFISLHADACENCDASGSSVFILSTKGASSAAAKWLAKKENEADLIGGGTLANVDQDLVPVVFDMVHDAVLADSLRLADKVLVSLNRVGDVHKGYVERAGFAVLKAPDVPSILVETAFISNPQEEARLGDPRHQERLAQAVLSGIRAYKRQRPPQDLLVAEAPAAVEPARARTAATSAAKRQKAAESGPAKQPLPNAVKPAMMVQTNAVQRPALRQVHVIQRGESLADIAQRYQVSLTSLRSANRLRVDQLRMPAGTQLTIPSSDS